MKKAKKGISLIEITIGVMLLVLMLVPSLNVMIGQTQTVTTTREHSQAAFLAQKIIEIAHSYGFDKLDADSKENEDPDKKGKTLEYKLLNDAEYNTYIINGITYQLDPEFTKIDPIKTKDSQEDSKPSLYALKYRIVYTSKDNRNHHLDVYTLLSKR